MDDKVSFLPIWKKGSTAEEFLSEVAHIAGKFPERFGKCVIVYEETLPTGETMTRYLCYGAEHDNRNLKTNEAIGLLEVGKIIIYKDTRSGGGTI